MNQLQTFNQFTFTWITTNADISCFLIDTICSLNISVHSAIILLNCYIIAYVLGWLVIQLFPYVNFGRLLNLPLECRKRNTSSTPLTQEATQATTENWTEQQFYMLVG
jgi:hypothetical protein